MHISHSQIISIGLAIDTSSSNASDAIYIETKDGNYYTKEKFTTDATGITGNFIKVT